MGLEITSRCEYLQLGPRCSDISQLEIWGDPNVPPHDFNTLDMRLLLEKTAEHKALVHRSCEVGWFIQ